MDFDLIPLSVLLAALLVVGFAIAAETSLTNVVRSDVRKLSEDGDGRAKRVDRLLRDPAQLLLTLLLLKTGGVLAAGGAVARLLPDTFSLSALIMAGLVAWALLAVLQAMGRGWVQTRTLQVALAVAPYMQMAVWLLLPVSTLVRRVGRPAGEEEDDSSVDAVFLGDDGLRRMMIAAEEEEPIQESEKRMIASILEMNETVAREVMVPRIDMVALSVETSLNDALAVIIAAGHSRIPIYEENIDQIVGFLYAKDVLKAFAIQQTDVPIRSLLRPPYLAPLSKKVDSLLREMQRDRVHIAMVVDEYGGIAGLVTIEDILEEIVGEIQDEYDPEEEAYIQPIGPNRYLLNGRLDLYTLAKLLDVELPEEDADTLGGLIYSELGHVPVAGEAMELAGWRFTVLTLDGRRVEEVRADAVDHKGDTERPAAEEDAKGEEDSAPQQTPSSILKLSASD